MNPKSTAQKLSFVLYEKNLPPRFYEVKKSTFRFYFVYFPVLTGILLVCLLGVIIYFKQIRSYIKLKEPAIIGSLKTENAKIKKSYKDLRTQVVQLEQKLAKSSISTPELNPLTLFSMSSAQIDKTSEGLFEIEASEFMTTKDKLHFKFNLVNKTPQNKKLAGYVFVAMKKQSQIAVYPENSFAIDEFRIPFNSGESFATSRFRPVDAHFEKPKTSGEALFMLIVYSRTGDLLLKKIIKKNLEL